MTTNKLKRKKQLIEDQAAMLVADYMDYISHVRDNKAQIGKYQELEEKWCKWLHKQTKADYEKYENLFADNLVLTMKNVTGYYEAQHTKQQADQKKISTKWRIALHRIVMWFIRVTETKKKT